MVLKTSLNGEIFNFSSVKEVLAKANEERSGDRLAGVIANSNKERVAAKVVLANLTVNDIFNNPIVPYEIDYVTRMIVDGIDRGAFNKVKNLTIGDLREKLLNFETNVHEINALSAGLSSEVIAAVAKLMSNLDLIYAANKIIVEKTCVTTIGKPKTFSARLQPNHPSDNVKGIMASVMEGLSFGIGDAVIGLNPVIDTWQSVKAVLDEFENFRTKWQIPTQTCVLAHVKTQIEAMKKGAKTGLVFQSIAGSQKGNEAFGFNADDIEEARQLALAQGIANGESVMYFETGQGAELSSDSHYGADQVTMEARCYGFAKKFNPFLVNTVVGFIGPEYLYDGKQVIRAGLEDHFMGKLHGLSMGCDVCYTNHMIADQNDAENLAVLLGTAGVNFIIGVPNGDDVMLNYQSTGYHETATIRELLGKRPIKEFEMWLEKTGIMKDGRLTELAGDGSIFC